MQLHALRPKRGADLVQLRNLLDGRGWRSALPDSLPDSVLLRLARDFRCVERGLDGDEFKPDEESSALAAAMYVIMNLLMNHPARSGARETLELSEPSLIRALQIYQVGLEREIVSRITGLTSSIPTDSLVDELVRCADE